MVGLVSSAQTFTPKFELINNPKFPTNDLAVATVNVMDYGADNTGTNDCSAIFQQLLDSLGDVRQATKRTEYHYNNAGGILYVPAGKYLLKNPLIIPRGVTLRGDWKKPVKGEAIEGTILLCRTASMTKTDETMAFITMQPSSEVSNIAFYYPRQNPKKIVKYPPTIVYGQRGYFGNEYCNVRHVTFINSYTGILFSSYNGGGCPNVFDIYGTPLYQGIVMDNIADVGRLDGIHFSPDYWESCGLAGSPSDGQIDNYLYNNATGIVMRRNDWSYTCNYDADHYAVGFSAEPSSPILSEGAKGNPNGHNYGFRFTNCKTGIKMTAVSGAGIMFTNVTTENCATGIDLNPGCEGPAQFYSCHIQGDENAVLAEDKVGSSIMMQDCQVEGPTSIRGGQLIANADTFGGDVLISEGARTVFTGNTFTNGGKLDNLSLFECKVSDNVVPTRPLPEFKEEWMQIKDARPSRAALYVVTDQEFGAKPVAPVANMDLSTAADCTSAIQKALDKASAEGGGIVYLPNGHYRMNGHLTIPTGVELKGSSDIATVPKRAGAILEVYENEGNENGTPFISMQPSSGVRGITIDYPNQNDPTSPKPYPYSIRGNANVYIVNVGLRTAYRGVDLFTNKCDNHYVDYLAGHAYMNVIRVGGNSKDGIISNIQCNTNAYSCGDETKYGCWPNSMNMSESSVASKAYGQNEEQLDFMIIGDTNGEILYNNFLFGCNKGMLFQSDGNGGAANVHSLGNAVDGAVNTIVVNKVATDLDLVNSQVVALNHDKSAEIINHSEPATFYTLGKDNDKNVTLFSSDNWGGGNYFAQVKGGTLNMYLPNLDASGASYTYSTTDNSKVNVCGGLFNQVKKLVQTRNTDEPRLSIYSSVITPSGADTLKCAAWDDNISTSWQLINKSSFLNRTGWKATAFNDETGSKGSARRGIDGSESSRWDSGASQASGQWYAVDFGAALNFNAVILDASASPSDGPAAYTVEVQDAETGEWTEVSKGTGAGSMLIVTFPNVTAKAVRINQTGSKGNYWSIHEFNVGNFQSITGIEQIETTSGKDAAEYMIYDIRGALVKKIPAADRTNVTGGLQSGIYIVRIMYVDGSETVKKIILK